MDAPDSPKPRPDSDPAGASPPPSGNAIYSSYMLPSYSPATPHPPDPVIPPDVPADAPGAADAALPGSLNGDSALPLPGRPLRGATAPLPPEPLREAALVAAPAADLAPVEVRETGVDALMATPLVVEEPAPAAPPVMDAPAPAAPQRPWLFETAANVPPTLAAPPQEVVAPAPPLVIPPGEEAAAVAAPAATVATTGRPTPPSGAMVLLPQEEVLNQLGALYLTNKRVILYAPTILRAAFLRDVDAVGTLTERASGLALFFGVLLLGLTGVAGYIAAQPNPITAGWPIVGQLPVWVPPLVLGVLGLFLLATYFFWVKKSLFLSVGGRPLIVVSLTGWSAKRLEGVDIFINAFSQARDGVDTSHHTNPR